MKLELCSPTERYRGRGPHFAVVVEILPNMVSKKHGGLTEINPGQMGIRASPKPQF